MLTALLILAFGPLARADATRIVYHLHQVHPVTMKRALNNIENLYKGLDTRIDIRMLLQGESLGLLERERLQPEHRKRLLALLRKGLVLETGAANYARHRARLDRAFKPLLNHNIITRLVELQRQGYRYVTP